MCDSYLPYESSKAPATRKHSPDCLRLALRLRTGLLRSIISTQSGGTSPGLKEKQRLICRYPAGKAGQASTLHSGAGHAPADNAAPVSLSGKGYVPKVRGSRILAALAIFSLAACGEHEAKISSQSLAKVGTTEITIHQFNDELQRLGPSSTEAGKPVLENLIDRQLLQNEAVRNKMEREPAVMQAIERAKAHILAQAYIHSKVNNGVKPSNEEVTLFFSQNPELFSQRKQFEMSEIVLEGKEPQTELKQAISQLKSADEVASWLDRKNIQYARQNISRSSADLPIERVKKIHDLKKGQSSLSSDGDRIIVSFVTNVTDSPVTLESSRTQIETYLTNKKREEAARAEIRRLRSVTDIVYLRNDMSPAKGEKTSAQDKTTGLQSTGNRPDESYMQRGVIGLR